jgi:hypothetical protein
MRRLQKASGKISYFAKKLCAMFPALMKKPIIWPRSLIATALVAIYAPSRTAESTIQMEMSRYYLHFPILGNIRTSRTVREHCQKLPDDVTRSR